MPTHRTIRADLIGGPFAEVGRQTFDGQGNTEGAATLSANGNIVRVTVQSTYVVNPDCTGFMTIYILPFGRVCQVVEKCERVIVRRLIAA